MIWHELVNDVVSEIPIVVSYCLLCNSAIVLDRRVDGSVCEFGVSGMLRHSGMVMFDRKTESLWQQFTGKALVGDMAGKNLWVISSQMVAFASALRSYPLAEVLSRETGHQRDYGKSPYAGYDMGGRTMFPVPYESKGQTRPLDRLVAIQAAAGAKAHFLEDVRRAVVKVDKLGDTRSVIFSEPTATSAVDMEDILFCRSVGSVGVFSPVLDGRELKFPKKGSRILDRQTGSEWDIFGRAIAGSLAGRQLEQLNHGVFYAFVWLSFYPQTRVIGGGGSASINSGPTTLNDRPLTGIGR